MFMSFSESRYFIRVPDCLTRRNFEKQNMKGKFRDVLSVFGHHTEIYEVVNFRRKKVYLVSSLRGSRTVRVVVCMHHMVAHGKEGPACWNK